MTGKNLITPAAGEGGRGETVNLFVPACAFEVVGRQREGGNLSEWLARLLMLEAGGGLRNDHAEDY